MLCSLLSKSRRTHQDEVVIRGRRQLLLHNIRINVPFTVLPKPAGGLVHDVVYLQKVASIALLAAKVKVCACSLAQALTALLQEYNRGNSLP